MQVVGNVKNVEFHYFVRRRLFHMIRMRRLKIFIKNRAAGKNRK